MFPNNKAIIAPIDDEFGDQKPPRGCAEGCSYYLLVLCFLVASVLYLIGPRRASIMSMFQKAQRRRAWLKMAVTGPSGSGKTYSALQLAKGLAGADGKIALIDTENESASLYSDRADFDTCPISAPFTTEKYIAAINSAAEAGYTVLIIDSLTHAWAGEGGLLAQKEALDARGGNSFTNWAGITKKQETFKSALLGAPIHVIATMRSKQEYVVNQGSDGRKAAPTKVGMAPIQRDGMEYEFTTVLDIGMGHEAVASKDRTGLFDGVVGMLTPKNGQTLRIWLESGAEPLPDPEAEQHATAAPAPVPDPADAAKRAEIAAIRAFAAKVFELGLDSHIVNDKGGVVKAKATHLLSQQFELEALPNLDALTADDWDDATRRLPDFARRLKAEEARKAEEAKANPFGEQAASTAAAPAAPAPNPADDLSDLKDPFAEDDDDPFMSTPDATPTLPRPASRTSNRGGLINTPGGGKSTSAQAAGL